MPFSRSIPKPGQQAGGRGGVLGLTVLGLRRDQDVFEEWRMSFKSSCDYGPVHHGDGGRGNVLSDQPVKGLHALLGRKPSGAGICQLTLDPLPLLLRFPDTRPRAPRDGLAGEAQGAPVGGELIQEGVGGGVIRLARVSHNAGYTGKQDKHVQVFGSGGLVEMPRSQHFGPHDLLEPLPGLVLDDAVGEDAHAMYDSA